MNSFPNIVLPLFLFTSYLQTNVKYTFELFLDLYRVKNPINDDIQFNIFIFTMPFSCHTKRNVQLRNTVHSALGSNPENVTAVIPLT